MLLHYESVQARIQHEIATEIGAPLGPALFVFHLQLILQDWFVDQTRTGQSSTIPAPDFGCYLKAFECQNDLNWLPLVSNAPALLALRDRPVRVQIAPHQAASPVVTATCAAPASERRDLGPHVRNPGHDARFTGNTAFANNLRARRVEEAINLAGGRDTLLKIYRDGVSIGVCVSYNGK
jgi:hypothetical protein